ncbi:MAG: UDP-3-O-acyl-N-acetylglucosamine deacetylase, partial [Acidaminococcaceae bacterium]|nr:UDP-3-O-acyl-N-acetylglucosamine deacetylase [Acidaminococcaceae bacterium]
MKKQVTLAAVADYSGIGLHSGKEVTMRLMPGEPDTGIVFIRTDLPGKPEIHARAELVTSTLKATTLSENGAQVFTVEHLLGALFAMGVDNCRIGMDAPEPPVTDGSGLVFAQLVQKAGRKEQEAEKTIYVVDKSFSVYDGDKF